MNLLSRPVVIVLLLVLCFSNPVYGFVFFNEATVKDSENGLSTAINADPDRIDLISTAVVQVETQGSVGSGTIVIWDGVPLVLTNRHVVKGYDTVQINMLHDLNKPAVPSYFARLYRYSMDYDVALMEITTDIDNNPVTAEQLKKGFEGTGNRLYDPVFSPSDSFVRRGEQIYLLSYPGIGDNELVLSMGLVASVVNEEFKGEFYPAWIRTNAEFSPGSSGGLALNSNWEVIGIPTYVRTENVTGGRLGSILAYPVLEAALRSEAVYSSWSDLQSGAGIERGLALNVNGEPEFGYIRLEAGFGPNPAEESMISGGEINTAYLGGECIGYAASVPDFILEWSGGGSELTIAFDALNPIDDTTLLVYGPEGRWHCNDDRAPGSLDPEITIFNPKDGNYKIWVGSYAEGDFLDGTLRISEGSISGASRYLATEVPRNLELSPQSAMHQIELNAGFMPDPASIYVTGQGPIELAQELGESCIGFSSANPIVLLEWSGSGRELQFFFEAEISGNDAVMVVKTPGGEFYCNDDAHSATLNPGLSFENPQEGNYLIWIGSYAEGAVVPGFLRISEGEIEELGGRFAVSLDGDLEPAFGTIHIRPGTENDVHQLVFRSGGSNNVSMLGLGEDCIGFAATAPDVWVDFSGNPGPLRFNFEANEPGADTTLIIQDPNGNWFCNDDAHNNTLNPAYQFRLAPRGIYKIWVGSYTESEYYQGTLTVSRGR